ncbi:hypothetical protein D3C72_2247450 [compost metagenome]
MSAVPPAMSRIVRDRAALRPTRSEYMPMRTPPMGRTTKPTPNVATDNNSDVRSLPVGKKSWPMVMAKNP